MRSQEARSPQEAPSRRELLARAATVGGAGVARAVLSTAIGASGTARADVNNWAGGTLLGRSKDTLILKSSQQQIRVQVLDSTVLMRDLPAEIQDFEVGDSLCARGEWQGDTFIAKAVM